MAGCLPLKIIQTWKEYALGPALLQQLWHNMHLGQLCHINCDERNKLSWHWHQMYNPELVTRVSSSRRYSYPNSPVHVATEKHNQVPMIYNAFLCGLRTGQISYSVLSLSSLMFVRPGTYQRVKRLKAASLGWALTLLANIKLGWKG